MERLISRLKAISYYPEGILPIHCEISGTGFFPGAKGTWSANSELLDKKVMVLGHDFGNYSDYQKSISRGSENMSALTWKNMVKMLDHYQVNIEECFFTNILLGARNKGSAIGKNPANRDDRYVEQCCDFFLYQLEIQQPKLILVLGIHAMKIVAALSAQLTDLLEVKTFKELDKSGKSIINQVIFPGLNNFTANIAFITHPTYWHLNVKNRRYKTLENIEAEKLMIADART